MTGRTAFTDEEWALLRLAPLFVAVGVVAADASGLFSSIREAVAGTNEMSEALAENPDLELFAALLAERRPPHVPDVESLLGRGSNETQMRNFKTAALGQVGAAVALLKRKASVAEVAGYQSLLTRVAERAANASKEGGFLGFGGVRVSDKEREFIDAVQKAAACE
jgi:hypothetical protein